MPPRIPAVSSLRAPTSPFTLPLRPFSSTPSVCIPPSRRPVFKKKVSHDPYILAQRAQKKAATLSRRDELQQQRQESLGDPVRGAPTPFVESFATGLPINHGPAAKVPKDELHLNYALKPVVVETALEKSKRLAVPLPPEDKEASMGKRNAFLNPNQGQKTKEVSPEELEKKKQADHERAAEALARITALSNGSSKDRMRVNITRCISTFGRHNTDHLLPPRAPPLKHVPAPSAPAEQTTHAIRPPTNDEAAKKRIGPDTGSSEVQIAILTAKIKTLSDFLAQRGKNDKHNKRNLRLLVHRRQKLLQYLRRKERGGPRWQHCIQTLGLTEGTWRGEISL